MTCLRGLGVEYVHGMQYKRIFINTFLNILPVLERAWNGGGGVVACYMFIELYPVIYESNYIPL